MPPQLTKRQIVESLRLARGIGNLEDAEYWEAELDKIKKKEEELANG